MTDRNRDTLPPVFWALKPEWLEAHQTLDYLFDRYRKNLSPVLDLVSLIGAGLEAMFPLFDRMSAEVCPGCTHVCCLEARVAFDFKDILFIHGMGLKPPPHQLRRNDNEHCRYLGPIGCRLPRIMRPFICTWYYCAPMLELFRKLPHREQRRQSSLMADVQKMRKTMETRFIEVVSGCEPLL